VVGKIKRIADHNGHRIRFAYYDDGNLLSETEEGGTNADGTDAHEILADEPALDKGVFSLTWSPAGDRIAMANSLGAHVAIYTFAPDGSDASPWTRVG